MKPAYHILPQSNSDGEAMRELQSSDADISSDDDANCSSDDDFMRTTDEQRSPEGTSSTWKATMNLVNYIEGTGLLSVPYAIKIGGNTAVISLLVMPIICWYAGVVVVECI